MASVKRFYQHINEEPAMILARKRFNNGAAFVVGLSSAYKYTDDAYLMEMAMKCADTLGLVPYVKSELVKICDTILDGLDDLVAFPPEDLAAGKLPTPEDINVTINGESVDVSGLIQ